MVMFKTWSRRRAVSRAAPKIISQSIVRSVHIACGALVFSRFLSQLEAHFFLNRSISGLFFPAEVVMSQVVLGKNSTLSRVSGGYCPPSLIRPTRFQTDPCDNIYLLRNIPEDLLRLVAIVRDGRHVVL